MKRIASLFALCLLTTPPASTLQAASYGKIDINDMLIVTADTPREGLETFQQDMPMGQSEGEDTSLLPEESSAADDDLFGTEVGYFHPYISASGEWTDNLFNLDDDKTSNFLTTLSPGIWFSLPRTLTIPISITPNNTSPGGLAQQVGFGESVDKLAFYALAGADFLFYSENSGLNTEDFDLEGMARYNMGSGLSLQIVEKYSLNQDEFGADGANEANQRKYQTNIFMGTADYDITEKFRVKADYIHFYLDYDDVENEDLNRQDNTFDLYTIYQYSPKSSLFLEYKYIDVAYDVATESDNSQNFYYGGVTWKTTDKVSLLFKVGLQQKEFDNEQAGYSDSDNLSYDFQVSYNFTEKTSSSLNLYMLNEESDSTAASEKEIIGANFTYNQRFTEKITGNVGITYENADYAQLSDEERTDDTFIFTPAIQYLFKDWLMAECGYTFEMDDSTDDLLDYETNIVFVSLNFSL